MEAKRFEFIDALRGLAIAGVVLVHCGQLFDDLPGWLRSLTNYGGKGVQLFFMLSALTLMNVYHTHTYIHTISYCVDSSE